MTRSATLPNPDHLWPEEAIPQVPLVTEKVMQAGRSREARLAREYLGSLPAERRAELERGWPS